MLKQDMPVTFSNPESSFDPAVTGGDVARCVGNIRSTGVIDQDVSRLLDLACAEQAAVVSHAARHASHGQDPSRLWMPEARSDALNPRAAILTAPIWDDTEERLIPQGCCLVEDSTDGQIKLTWRYGPNRLSALVAQDSYQRLLDSGTIVE